MFSDKMAKAVTSAQKVIDKICVSDNISITAAVDLKSFSDTISALDPSGIDFTKTGMFNGKKTRDYWNEFNGRYGDLKRADKRITVDRQVASNTLKTLNIEYKRFKDVYDQFTADGMSQSEADSETAAQMAVASNMNSIFQNTIYEYEVLFKRLDSTVRISKQVLDVAILIAKVDTKQRFGSVPDDFVKIFSQVKNII